MFSDRRVLVTGGAGFIGSHLCERLLGRGDEVLCADNFFTATRPNVSGLMLNSRFELVRHDVCFPLYVEVDKIYNFACPASPIHHHSTQYRRPRPALTAPSTCWVSPNA